MLTRKAKSNRGCAIALLVSIACLFGSPWSHSDQISAQTLCAAGQAGGHVPQIASEVQHGSARSDRLNRRDDTLSVMLPSEPLLLAQPAQITVSVTEGEIKSIRIYQITQSGAVGNTHSGVDLNGDPRILRDEGQTRVVQFTPVQIGEGSLHVYVYFMDGGESLKSCPINVGASAKGLKKFELHREFHTMAIILGDTERSGERWLEPEVFYDQLDNPIYLAPSSQIRFTVDQPENDPVIRVDDDGLVHGLRPGVATITGDFDGVQDTVKVTVHAKGGSAFTLRPR